MQEPSSMVRFFFPDEQNNNLSQGFPPRLLISCINLHTFPQAKVGFHYHAAG